MVRFYQVLLGLIWSFVVISSASANPHPNESRVPKVKAAFWSKKFKLPVDKLPSQSSLREGSPVLRVRVDWDGGKYTFGAAVRESSGTESLVRRAKSKDALGSFRAEIYDRDSGAFLASDSIGTGVKYRGLTRALSFRFPLHGKTVLFRMRGENARSGVMQTVLEQEISPSNLKEWPSQKDVEVVLFKQASIEPKLILNIYAEGYSASAKARFYQDAARALDVLWDKKFPGFERFEIRAVFAPSGRSLGGASNLGFPIPERDSFLGLYYPYWDDMQRWYHVVYPTREERFRRGLAQVAYDYAFALVDSSSYWGVGNYRELTAVPSKSSSFAYLLIHEMGHFFGLNEEYNGGGATELAFAPEIKEPWSQNITFQTNLSSLKWKPQVKSSTPIPTPSSHWRSNGPYGAYRGGYADTVPLGKAHKPGLSCVMDSGQNFCPICRKAIEDRVQFDLGIKVL